MSEDDFDRLTAGLRAAPAPDPGARDATLRLAMENFDRLQGSATSARPMSTSRKGFWTGVQDMLNFLSGRQMLAATTSVAALCIGVVLTVPQWRDGLTGGPDIIPQVPAEAPAQPAKPRADDATGPAKPLEQRAEAPSPEQDLSRDQSLTNALPPPEPSGTAPLATTAPPPPPTPVPATEVLPETAPVTSMLAEAPLTAPSAKAMAGGA